MENKTEKICLKFTFLTIHVRFQSYSYGLIETNIVVHMIYDRHGSEE